MRQGYPWAEETNRQKYRESRKAPPDSEQTIGWPQPAWGEEFVTTVN